MIGRTAKKFTAAALTVIVAATMIPAVPNMVAFADDNLTQYDSADVVMSKIFDTLESDNSKWSGNKLLYLDYAEPSEELGEDYSITLSRNEYPDYADLYDDNGVATFYYDEQSGFINCTMSDNDFWTYNAVYYMADAIARCYGMEYSVVEGYINAVVGSTKDFSEGIVAGPYFMMTTDPVVENPDEDTNSVRLTNIGIFAAEKWDEDVMNTEVLDKVYYDETVIQNSTVIEELSDKESVSGLSHLGKFYVYYEGNKSELTLVLAERGSYDKMGQDSIKNLIAAMKPYGYETFDFSGEPGESKGVWSVEKIDKSAAPEIFGDVDDGYDYILVTFASPYIYNGTGSKLEAGEFVYVSVANAKVKSWTSSDKKVATVDKYGHVYALKKGTTTITATLDSGKKLTYKVKVTSNPTISIDGKKFNKKKTYTVKQGKNLTVALLGKADGVKNSYSSSNKKVAKVTTKNKNAYFVKIKGVKKGNSKVTIKVNGVNFKINVKVTE